MNNYKDLTTGLIYEGARRSMQNCIKTVKNLQKTVENRIKLYRNCK